ncbi:type II toxin-antitoxin system RnlB family antitoxin [Priestia megaterium]
MKNYEIQELNVIEGYSHVIYSTSHVNPVKELKEIAEDLKSHFEVKGKVLFDLLLSNGVSSNRFLEAEFDGLAFNRSSFKSLNDVNQLIKKESSEFYQKNLDFVENSVLPNVHQFLIKKGKLI